MNREYGAFPIIAVGGIIFIDNKVVLIKRKNLPEKGKWTIPGGAVLVGELIEDALRREILEETGLVVSVKNLVEIAEKIIRDGNHKVKYHYIILDYLCEFVSGKISAHSDAEDVKTVDINNINELDLIDGTMNVIRKGYEFIKNDVKGSLF